MAQTIYKETSRRRREQEVRNGKEEPDTRDEGEERGYDECLKRHKKQESKVIEERAIFRVSILSPSACSSSSLSIMEPLRLDNRSRRGILLMLFSPSPLLSHLLPCFIAKLASLAITRIRSICSPLTYLSDDAGWTENRG